MILHFLKAKIHQMTKFRAPKMAKTAYLELLNSQKSISREIRMTENREISTLWPSFP